MPSERDKARAVVRRAYQNGTLGVLAATENIAEGKLREFALGREDALTQEQIDRIAWRAAGVSDE